MLLFRFIYRQMFLIDSSSEDIAFEFVHGLSGEDAMQQRENNRRFRAGLDQRDQTAIPRCLGNRSTSFSRLRKDFIPNLRDSDDARTASLYP